MIHELGNVEYFEICATGSRVQCSFCLSCWAIRIVYWSCRICYSHIDAMRRLNRKRFDASSISNYVLMKGCCNQTWEIRRTSLLSQLNAWKRCQKRTDESSHTKHDLWPTCQRSKIPWNEGKTWMDRRWVKRNERISTRRSHSQVDENPSSIDVDQIGVYNCTMQKTMGRWRLEQIIVQQSHWKIICTRIRKIIRSQFHHSIQTEFRTASSSSSW